MKWTLESKLPAGFILAVAALCAAGFASYRSTEEFAEAGKSLAHSQEVLRELESTVLVVKEAEAHRLALLASGNASLQTSSALAASIHTKFSRLKELTSGANSRSARVHELEEHVARQAELLQQLSNSRREIPAPAIEIEALWRGVASLSEQIRMSAATIADSENETIRQHLETVKVKARQSAITFMVLATLTALFIGFAFYHLSRHMRERRHAMEQLRHSEERYRLLADNSLDLIALLDLKGNLIYASPSHETVLGYDPAWLVGRGFSVLLHPEDLTRVQLAISQLPENGPGRPTDVRLRLASGDWLEVELLLSTFSIRGVSRHRILLSARSIAERKRSQQEREKLIQELQDAFAKIKVLSGFIPICASCKKIRDDQGYWNQLEAYIQSHTEAQFSHGICPDCATSLYSDYFTKGA
ncbi:MAG TPA: PAS domain S-box protein [Terriglobia bacterium]|nr:PAS domain S-box protein [Terriglobia bacterium]